MKRQKILRLFGKNIVVVEDDQEPEQQHKQHANPQLIEEMNPVGNESLQGTPSLSLETQEEVIFEGLFKPVSQETYSSSSSSASLNKKRKFVEDTDDGNRMNSSSKGKEKITDDSEPWLSPMNMETLLMSKGIEISEGGKKKSKGKEKVEDYDGPRGFQEPLSKRMKQMELVEAMQKGFKGGVKIFDNADEGQIKKGKKIMKGSTSKRPQKIRGQDQARNQEPELPPVPVPEEILARIRSEGGTEPVLLFRKVMTKSDLDKSLNRYFICRYERLVGYLTEAERDLVGVNDRNGIGIDVLTIDPMGNQYALRLKRWPTQKSLALNGQWNRLFTANGLREDDIVYAWGYRVGSEHS